MLASDLKRIKATFLVAGMVLYTCMSWSANAQSKELAPELVETGIYLQDIRSFDLKSNEFVAVFWLWFRWKGNLSPLETFEVVDGEITGKHGQAIETARDGSRYGIVRVTATIHDVFDLRRFPVDNHRFRIRIEDTDADSSKLVYTPDLANSALKPKLAVPGWHLRKAYASSGVSQYHSSYGDPTVKSGTVSSFSRFQYNVEIARDGYWYMFKLLLPTYCAVLISLLAFFISPDRIEPRMGLGVGAVFAAIANSYVTTQSLPDSQVITLADAVSNLSTLVIFIGLLVSTVSLYLYERGTRRQSRRLDRGAFALTALGYLTANVFLILGW